MGKKYVIPLLIILFVPVFLGLIKVTSMLLIKMFNAEYENSVAFATMLIIIATGCAIGSYAYIHDEEKQKARRYLS